MWSDGNGVRTLKGSSGMTRVEIASAVEQIVAAVADEHGLMDARDGVTRVMLNSRLDNDLGMDEVDLIDPQPLQRATNLVVRLASSAFPGFGGQEDAVAMLDVGVVARDHGEIAALSCQLAAVRAEAQTSSNSAVK